MARPRMSGPATSLALCVATAAWGALFAPAVVNGDGLGYLKAAPTGWLVPGHLGYLPLLRALATVTGHKTPLALLGPARALSIASLAIAVAAMHEAARRLFSARAALLAAVGVGVSFGALQAGADVETYAPSLAALCLTLAFALVRRSGGGSIWVVATAAGVAAASLLHVENVLVAPAAALLCAQPDPRGGARWPVRLVDAAAVLGCSAALVLAGYLVAFHARGDTAKTAIAWVAGANHGFTYPLRWYSPVVAVYGMAKTLVYAAYPGQESWPVVVGQTLAGVSALVALAWLCRRPSRPATLGAVAAAAWIAPYAVVGFAFFASDNERWIFLLPPVWMVAGAAASTGRREMRVATGLVVALAVADLALGLPLAADRSLRDRAEAVENVLRVGDLVISPGHSWDEYLGFYRGRSLDRFPMIYFCGLLGGASAMRAELAHRVVDARARGARVWFARGDEPMTSDGWKELAQFGITTTNVDSFLPSGTRVAVARGLVRIDAR